MPFNTPRTIRAVALATPLPSTVGDPGVPDLAAEIARLTAENAALRAAKSGPLSCKVGEKGGVMVIGLGRFPVTLYQEQWAKLIAFIPQLESFIRANRHLLSSKG